ncbi:hypothetical protein BS47DRAFT_1253849, partial [Hydnum rufescens UP504]
VEVQFAAFLQHFGSSNQHHLNTACECNIGAGTVFLYVDHVIQALGDLGPHFIKWPDQTRCAEIHKAFGEQGFPGAIGAINGSLIHFVEVPAVDGSYYYCHKKFFGANIQAMVDHEGYFTSYDIGWPASQNDIVIFKKSSIWLERHKFFEPDKYLLAD